MCLPAYQRSRRTSFVLTRICEQVGLADCSGNAFTGRRHRFVIGTHPRYYRCAASRSMVIYVDQNANGGKTAI
jgi:hypothetical protein